MLFDGVAVSVENAEFALRCLMVAGTDQIHPNIIARPVGRESVLTVVGPGAEGRGPWSFVTGIPNPGFDMVGPNP